MPTFFKHIRRSHMMKTNTKKYLKYAIGEIILVVIGILIALTINNWNEVNKLEKEEIKLLQLVHTDITTNKVDIDTLLNRLESKKTAMDTVMLALREKSYQSVRTSFFLSFFHRKTFFNKKTSGYKRIGSSTETIIKNDTILNAILELYEIDFDNVLKFQSIMHNHLDTKLYPLTNKYFEVSPTYKIKYDTDTDVGQTNFFKPVDIEQLYTNNEYKNTLFLINESYINRIKHLKYVRNNINALLEKIELEIDSR